MQDVGAAGECTPPGARFNAYDTLFSILKLPDESLQALMARVDKAMQEIKELRDAEFTLDKMDNELVCMTLLRALPDVLEVRD